MIKVPARAERVQGTRVRSPTPAPHCGHRILPSRGYDDLCPEGGWRKLLFTFSTTHVVTSPTLSAIRFTAFR